MINSLKLLFQQIWRNNSKIDEQMTLEEAKSIAKKVCQEQRWVFREPIKIGSNKKYWWIRTNSECIGCNALITVSKATKEIVKIGYCPR